MMERFSLHQYIVKIVIDIRNCDCLNEAFDKVADGLVEGAILFESLRDVRF